ncbi:deoxynucleotidyltransferase terminal interacting protein 1 [Willisornis vidua]|uniref:Deoxynucleotidyltransferase terminal-interacting protein 1 n=1 Tax=Willisornis vidua TaxID=1566151 RepID=A0ABQ9D4D4_9PASS|nr:deoxynucleotidyltransferase terminal interacting protein 1 [Willisornis vidua]
MTTSFTDPSVSMELLRAVLQPSINEEIRGVFNKYMKFFQTAAINVRDNVGEEVDPEQLIQETCRSCLEQAKLLFSDGKKVVPRLPHEQAVPKRARQMDEELSRRGSPVPKKYAADPQDKHWLAEQQHMRATGGKMAYLLIEEDIRDLAASEDYRDSVDLRLEELKPFIPPAWMTEKMQRHMETLRRGGDAPPPEDPPEP